jgi:hypothetical protein
VKSGAFGGDLRGILYPMCRRWQTLRVNATVLGEVA